LYSISCGGSVMRTAAGIGVFFYFRPSSQAKIREQFHAKDWCCSDFPLGEPIQSGGRRHLQSSGVTKDYAATIRQTHAFAAHSLLQQRLHALQLSHQKTEFTVFLPSQALPADRGGCSFAEPLEEGPDFLDGKPRLASESDETQVELCLGQETPLAAPPERWREDSRLLIKTNRRGAETRTPGDFTNSHFSLDLKCALMQSPEH
jgi:hypothetical protein